MSSYKEIAKAYLQSKLDEAAKYPHMMYHPETGEEKEVKTPEEHEKLAKAGWGHEKPELAEAEVELDEQFVVKYAKNKRGPIYQTKFKTQPEAEKFLAQKKKEGMNGIVSKAGKPVSMQKMADLQKESTAAYAASLEKMANDKKLKSISKADRETLAKLADLMKNANEAVVEAEITNEDLKERKLNPRNLDDQELLKKAIAIAMDKFPKDRKRAEREIAKLERGKELLSHPTVQTALKRAPYQSFEGRELNVDEDKERYQKFFNAALKKFGVKSPADLKGDKKKEFFDYVDKNYEADNESD